MKGRRIFGCMANQMEIAGDLDRPISDKKTVGQPLHLTSLLRRPTPDA
jgi:hypothetical protein